MKIKQFIYVNYDKILLMATLLYAIFMFIWIVKLSKDLSIQKSQNFTIIAKTKSYLPLSKDSYDYVSLMRSVAFWTESQKRERNSNDWFYTPAYTDFMNPYLIARSSDPNAKGKFIPYESYKVGVCPITNEKIYLPLSDINDLIDSDKDGIPDAIEKRMGLNLNSFDDAYKDLDNDSFTNLQNFEYNPEGIKSPNIHPPLIIRVVLVDISRNILPIVFKRIIEKDSDKTDWDIQCNLKEDGVWKTKFLKISSIIELNNMEYRIVDIKVKKEKKLDPRVGDFVEKNVSDIILENKLGDIVSSKLDSYIYEPRSVATVEDLYYKNKYDLRKGDILSLQTPLGNVEKYQLKDIDDKNRILMFISEKDKKEYKVTDTTTYIPPK